MRITAASPISIWSRTGTSAACSARMRQLGRGSLYDAVEAAAREQGIRSLFTEASELARRLFERKGFAVVERQDLVICGVAIHNYRIAEALD
jgi:N-acetylglutamate synthase-like GNAT family acetyltransferase